MKPNVYVAFDLETTGLDFAYQIFFTQSIPILNMTKSSKSPWNALKMANPKKAKIF